MFSIHKFTLHINNNAFNKFQGHRGLILPKPYGINILTLNIGFKDNYLTGRETVYLMSVTHTDIE